MGLSVARWLPFWAMTAGSSVGAAVEGGTLRNPSLCGPPVIALQVSEHLELALERPSSRRVFQTIIASHHMVGFFGSLLC